MDLEFKEEFEKTNKKSKILFILLMLFGFLFLLVLGAGAYFKIFYNKILFTESLDYVYETFIEDNELFDKVDQYDKVQFDGNMELSLKLSNEYKQSLGLTDFDLESIGLNLVFQLDRSNKEFYTDIKYLENKKDVLSLEMISNVSSSYIKSNNLYDKVLSDFEVADESFEELFVVEDNNLEDLKNVIYLTKEIVNKNFDNKKIIKEKETVSIESENFDITKYSYRLVNQEYKTFIIAILNDMKNSNEYVDALVNYTKKEKTDLLSSIDEKIKDINESENIETEFNIYTTGIFRKIVGFGFGFKDEYGDISVAILNIENKYKLELNDGLDSLTLQGYEEDNVIMLKMMENNELLSNITLKKLNDKIEIAFIEPENLFAIKFGITTGDNKNISIEYVGMENNLNLGFNMGFSLKEVDSITKFDTTNAVDISSLSDLENEKISNNLLTSLSESKLFSLILNFYQQFQNSLDNNSEI